MKINSLIPTTLGAVVDVRIETEIDRQVVDGLAEGNYWAAVTKVFDPNYATPEFPKGSLTGTRITLIDPVRMAAEKKTRKKK